MHKQLSFLFFFLILASLYLLIVGVEVYCCARSHLVTRAHARTQSQ